MKYSDAIIKRIKNKSIDEFDDILYRKSLNSFRYCVIAFRSASEKEENSVVSCHLLHS